jgi:hypothetical protein
MDAPHRGAGQSTLVSEIRWAARVQGDAFRGFLLGCVSFSRLILQRRRER